MTAAVQAASSPTSSLASVTARVLHEQVVSQLMCQNLWELGGRAELSNLAGICAYPPGRRAAAGPPPTCGFKASSPDAQARHSYESWQPTYPSPIQSHAPLGTRYRRYTNLFSALPRARSTSSAASAQPLKSSNAQLPKLHAAPYLQPKARGNKGRHNKRQE